ncbi:MAG: DUF1116 domain-containing protein [Ectothiorhodospiraceae bacterium]|nr:DUF1116 domain-containing protein [Ectothiorhodospiraceae bacterium]MCH8504906.1 DUF1116 domain-containing protein [Ectothiorhodospiraceae bacterium]
MSDQQGGLSTSQVSTRNAARRLAEARLQWFATVQAREFLDLGPDELLHAGPPFHDIVDIPAPILNAACAALMFEGRTDDPGRARAMLLAGDVGLRSAQDSGTVSPLAAVVSPSMWLHAVRDAGSGEALACAPLSEGTGPAQRFGLLSPEVVKRLVLVHGEIGPGMARVDVSSLDLFELAAEGLASGDELHARVGVGSELLAKRLQQLGLSGEAGAFMHANPQSFLNLWMAACRCMLSAAALERDGDLLVAAGGNGLEFGIQRSGSPGQWQTAPASPPVGPALAAEHANRPRLPAIGDSAVIDAVGFGALALDAAPAFAELLDPIVVDEIRQAASRLLVAPHARLRRHVGLDASRVSPGQLPGVCLAALDATGEVGIVGRGIALHPASLYD